MPLEERRANYASYLDEAMKWASELEKQAPPRPHMLAGTLGELQFFALPECCVSADTKKSGAN